MGAGVIWGHDLISQKSGSCPQIITKNPLIIDGLQWYHVFMDPIHYFACFWRGICYKYHRNISGGGEDSRRSELGKLKKTDRAIHQSIL